jgi:hypothetical protein
MNSPPAIQCRFTALSLFRSTSFFFHVLQPNAPAKVFMSWLLTSGNTDKPLFLASRTWQNLMISLDVDLGYCLMAVGSGYGLRRSRRIESRSQARLTFWQGGWCGHELGRRRTQRCREGRSLVVSSVSKRETVCPMTRKTLAASSTASSTFDSRRMRRSQINGRVKQNV